MPVIIPILGFALCFGAILVALLVVFKPFRSAVPAERRRPFGSNKNKTALSNITDSTVAVLDRTVGGGPYSRSKLEDAGLRMPPSNFLVLVIASAAVAGLSGLLLAGPLLAIVLALVAPLAAMAYLTFRADSRRGKFDQQLGDNIMLITGGLRAGHSVLASLDAAAQEALAPSSEEFARIVNEVRIGRDLEAALADTAARMKSDDFAWIGQAVQINREVGGDLAEVLDHVGETIRERGQIKAQVKALSAEGRLSAIILLVLPFGIGLSLMVVNPTYLGVLTTHVLGWVMLGVGAVMMVIGSLWLRKIVQIKF
ncbi:type II secretion system F family protein [Arthrobacter sp. 35W]|uniref:type II secretion system F family protein n=1 Tax=Arthrobacter sp. 35W TaxID=1132441 RepID=UPI00040B26E3|nr:type II secretion system F family protein [Arthrobacter sp. 35W]